MPFVLENIIKPPAPDNNPPTVGDPTISDANITQDSFDLSWNLATDTETDDATIYYILYESTSSNIGTIADMKANGTIVDEGFQLSSASITGKASDTPYYHNVLARDANGNELGYTQKQTTTATQTSGLDSQAGDVAALEALYTSLNQPALTGWSSNMSLSDTIEGVTVETINSELRVKRLDLQNQSLTGNIEVPELINLKEMELFCVYQNNLLSGVPRELMNLTVEGNLKYIYLSRTDNYEDDGQIEPYPHEQAQIGGLDVHPGKNKAGEGNRFTGIVPAPDNPASSILEWFVLDWTDTDFSATDGIQGFEDAFYDIPSFVGVHHYHNNALSRPFPTGLTNMTQMTHLAVTGRNGGSENWFTGSMPAAMSNLVNMQYCRIENCDNLLIDFDVVDFSGWTDMRAVYFSACQLTGSLPAYWYDGSVPNILSIGLSWPQGGTGFTGAHPEVAAAMNIKVYQYRNNNLTSLPASLWQNSSSIIQPEFTDNQLTTIGTTDLTQQTQLRYLRLSGNELHENIPFLNWGSHPSITGGVEFQNNRYVFKHLLYVPPNAPAGETALELWQTISGNDVTYAPQKTFGSLSNESNGVIDFSGIVNHTGNVYQWYKDGNALSGETSNILDTSGYGAGGYHLEVTNPDAPALTLNSVNIDIE
nr:hypothetical protein 17 [Balneolaceae bacterium]